jgi:hypothetical protein
MGIAECKCGERTGKGNKNEKVNKQGNRDAQMTIRNIGIAKAGGRQN